MPHVIWLARHANRQDFVDPDWPETAERPHDPGLSPDGVEQAEQLADRLAQTTIDRIVASPFLRTVHTAHAVADALAQPLWLEPGLGEWRNADWFDAPPKLLAPDALSERFDRATLHDPPCVTPIFPESRAAMIKRMGAAARCLIRRYKTVNELLVVGHGATVYGVLKNLTDEPVPDKDCPLASVTRLARHEGRWTITLRNDTSHLDEAAAADRFQ